MGLQTELSRHLCAEPLRPYQETITKMDASVIVPMNNGKELLGWLTLSDKEDNARRFAEMLAACVKDKGLQKTPNAPSKLRLGSRH